MATIVIINTNNNSQSDSLALEAAKSGINTVIVRKDAELGEEHEHLHVASLAGGELEQTLNKIATEHSGDIVLIDGELPFSHDALKTIINNTEETISGTFALKLQDGKLHHVEDFTIENIIHAISDSTQLPLGVIMTKAENITDLYGVHTAGEAILKALIRTLANDEAITTEITEIASSLPTLNVADIINKESRARVLRFAVESFNIEELFPNHAWSDHQEESAAACYHTLAARFIGLDDFDAAMECLALSDRLEDSPRSLALKGLIALGKGETLSAVANMVSSLQEYERRKKETENHYLTFTPKNLEQINHSLQSGLNALNQRENDQAVNHFQEAVFNFDSFYEDCGLGMKQ